MWRGLYEVSRVSSDVRRALGAYEIAEEKCVGTSLADDALWNQVTITAKRKSRRSEAAVLAERLVQDFPVSDMAPRARKWLKEFGVTTSSTQPARLSRPRGSSCTGETNQRLNHPIRLENVKYWSNEDYVRVSMCPKRPTEFEVEVLFPGDEKKREAGRVFVDMTTVECGY